jgi:hypothetical protein
VAHLASQHLAAVLGELSLGHVEKHAKHQPTDNSLILAATPGGNPPDRVLMEDAEFRFIGSRHLSSRRKHRSDVAQVLGMDMREEVLERCRATRLNAPQDTGRGRRG